MKTVCLISGGIDSPVAAQIAILRGFQPILLHYHNYPFHSPGTLEKVVALANKIAERNKKMHLTLAIMMHGKTQESILNNLEGNEIRQTCLFCRMQMYIKGQNFAVARGIDSIISGEIMGEQASQTLNNLPIVISKINILALRPLLGYNKEEVVKLSKEWGFYNLSILPGGCCSINPKYPETKGTDVIVSPIYERIAKHLQSTAEAEIEEIKEFPLPIDLSEVLNEVKT
ncbi:MAG: hypothetical protein ACXABI_06130 [Candidatus Hodarchaeales archaeon]|jgi:thiamine biosynthesis protein ThiI